MPLPAIQVENLSKAYQIGLKEEIPDTLAGMAKSWLKSPAANWKRLRRLNTFQENGATDESEDTLWALKDVSFDVQEGEVVGIIGRNGAGKSTLLKILSRITEPTAGRAIIRGRVSSLLEVGTGFHPELTGRENVYMNGTILGMRKKEIDRKFDEIVEFSGVEKFLDTPTKRYSSGMKVRLAFAVAAHLEPEILVIDEVLAVGDQDFQTKCLGKMSSIANHGRTVLFVSHNLPAIGGLCERSIWINEGIKEDDGDSDPVIRSYLSSTANKADSLATRTDREGDGSIVIQQIQFGTVGNPKSGHWLTGDDVIIDILYRAPSDLPDSRIDVAIGIRTTTDRPLLYLSTQLTKTPLTGAKRTGIFRCVLNDLPLELNSYRLNVEIKRQGIKADHVKGAATVDVSGGDYFGTGSMPRYGGVVCQHGWQHREVEQREFDPAK
jgi:lipopolysaccharide transport system ATP-binding protein